jgi:hypothetical protein
VQACDAGPALQSDEEDGIASSEEEHEAGPTAADMQQVAAPVMGRSKPGSAKAGRKADRHDASGAARHGASRRGAARVPRDGSKNKLKGRSKGTGKAKAPGNPRKSGKR